MKKSSILAGVASFSLIASLLGVSPARAVDHGSIENIEISSTKLHTCAIDFYGEVECFGFSAYGETDIPNDLGTAKTLASGDYHVCAIKENNTVDCWGGDSYDRIKLPEVAKNRKNATHITEDACAVYDRRHVVCYGIVGQSEWDYGSQGISKISGGQSGLSSIGSTLCVLDVTGPVKCTGGVWEIIFAAHLEITDIAMVDSTLCALTKQGEVLCKNRDYKTQKWSESWIASTSASTLHAGGNYFCATAGTSMSACWDRYGGEVTKPITDLSQVTSFALGDYSGDFCKVASNVLTCQNDQEGEYLGPDVLPEDIPLENLQAIMLPGGGVDFSVVLPFRDDTNGNLRWVVKYGSQVLCEFDYNNSVDCKVGGFVPGVSYNVKIYGVNRSGETKGRSFPGFTYCPPNPIIQLSATKKIVVVGSKASIKGELANLCSTPKAYKIRTQEAGKSWSGWTTKALGKSMKFSLTPVISVNTKFQIQATDRGKTYTSAVLVVSAAIKESLSALKISHTQKRNSQGFNQGGTFKVNFVGPTAFAGKCWLAARTDYAFNFAGTWVGREDKLVWFYVKNGRGSASLSARWNGKFEVVSSCSSSKYFDVVARKVILLKFNY